MRIAVERTVTTDGDGNEVVNYLIAEHLRRHVARYTIEDGVTWAELDDVAVVTASLSSIEKVLTVKGVVTVREIADEKAAQAVQAATAAVDTEAITR